MTCLLRIALAALLAGAVAIFPASAGVPVFPVPLADPFEPADEWPVALADRTLRAGTAAPPVALADRLPLPTGPAPHVRPSSGPFYASVAPHVRFCVWRE